VRCPDNAGLQKLTNALQAGALTLTGAGDQFASSAEFLLNYGQSESTPRYVRLLYRNILGRQADPAGLAYLVGQLNAGISRGDSVGWLSESERVQGRHRQIRWRSCRLVLPAVCIGCQRQRAAELAGLPPRLRPADTLVRARYPAGLIRLPMCSWFSRAFCGRPVHSGALQRLWRCFGPPARVRRAARGEHAARFPANSIPMSRHISSCTWRALLRVRSTGTGTTGGILWAGNSVQIGCRRPFVPVRNSRTAMVR